ncbi:RHS repeat-associated core domain-containing protein [Amycolatopsis sp. NPDC023774]|uniref:RHS repeat-associated core domain-containing protein n=1 Tax=Amycolatopsis sp. NPDC023774 TaxID=3155015 RepID=UPI0033FEBD01
MTNPLIAPTQDSTKAYSGISLLETANDLSTAIETGDWASAAMGAVGTGLDALSMAMDPFGAILAAGVSWLMEHVGPLKEALNGLTGNADQIKAQSETWANVAQELGTVASDLNDAVSADLQSWSGPGADAYRRRAQDLSTSLLAARKGCEGASSGVKTAGEVVAAVRTLVRDIISELVGHLVSWALQVVFTVGIGMGWVVPQVVNAVAKTAAQIAQLTTKLIKALKTLVPLLKQSGTLFEDVGTAFKGLNRGKVAAPSKAGNVGSMPKALPKALPKLPGDEGGGTSKGGFAPPPASKAESADTTHTSSADSGSADTTHASGAGRGSDGGDTPPPPKVNPTPAKSLTDPETAAADSSPSSGGGLPEVTPRSVSPRSDEPAPPRDSAVPADGRVCKSDPVDIATGDVVMTQTDIRAPGDGAELVLSRTHVSSYRAGHWFGRSWASTLDQRVEVDSENIRFFSEDGMILVYPQPVGDVPVLPVEGPRYALQRVPGGYLLAGGSRRLHFGPVPGSATNIFPLTAIEQAGTHTTIEYTPGGAPSLLRRDDGCEIRVTADTERVLSLAAVEGASGHTVVAVRFGYNRLGQLTHVVDSAGRPMTLDYDFGHRLVGWQDRNGTWFRYVYDNAGRCIRSVGMEGYYNAHFAYDTAARVTRHTDALGHTWTYRMNAAGQLVEEIDPLGSSRQYAWSRYDQLRYQVDELGRVTFYRYDDTDELTAVTRPDGSVVRISTGVAGGVVLETGEDKSVARSAIEPGLTPSRFAALPGVSAPFDTGSRGDALNDDPVTTTAARPEDRDLFGRPKTVHTSSGGRVRLGWTPEGNRAWRIGPHGGRDDSRFDAEGQVIEHRDPAGGVTRRTYGPFGLPTADIDTAGARTTYSYDKELRLVAVTNPQGLVWRYTYDPVGRLIEETDFDGRTLTYTYDRAGQLLQMANGRGDITEFAYDLLGNVVERRTPTGATRYEYDTLGRLTLAANADSTLRIVHDEQGHVLEESVNGAGVRWTYDETGVRRRTPSGITSEWRYADTGVPVSLHIAAHELCFEHDEAGREVSRSLDGEVLLRQRFGAEDQLEEQVITGLGRRGYAYRPDGRLAAVDDEVTGLLRFGFDAAGRVSEVHGRGGGERFTYDLAGNIVSAATASAAGPRTYQGNTLRAAGATRYSHDAQGRVMGRLQTGIAGAQEWRYAWDALDRMTGLNAPDGTRWSYFYDALGRRFLKQRWEVGQGGQYTKTAEIWFIWSGADLVEQVELHDDGFCRVLTWERHPADGRPVVQIEQSDSHRMRFHTIVTSPAGTPTELLDENNVLAWQSRTSFWGERSPSVIASVPMPLAFPGQYHDDESGLHYNMYRYYDPQTARYLSQDPLGLRPASNPVAYVAEPLIAADPLGLQGTCGGGGASTTPNRPLGGDDAAKLEPSAKFPDGIRSVKNSGDFTDFSYTDFSNYAKNSHKLNELGAGSNQSWFWSGGFFKEDGSYSHSVMDQAGDMSRKHGGTTLEALTENHPNIGMPVGRNNFDPKATDAEIEKNDPMRGTIWRDASEAFTRNSEGDVHVVFGPSRRQKNVFDMSEFPALRHNPNVDRIWAHDARSGAVDLLWDRKTDRPGPGD